jgi:hypothetical protein
MNDADEQPPADFEADSPPSLPYASPLTNDPPHTHLSRVDVACIVVRVIGAYAVINSLQFLPSIIRLRDNSFNDQLPYIGAFAIAAGIGIALLLSSRKLGVWLLPHTVVNVEPPSAAPQAQWLAMAFAVLGMYFAASALPLLAWYVTVIVIPMRVSVASSIARSAAAGPTNTPGLIRHVVEFGIGVWLFLGSSSIARWWWSLRHPEFKSVYHEPADEDKHPE